MRYTDEQIDLLRSKIGTAMSARRFEHTLGVEKMTARIAAIYCPESESILRAAALLHDVTKELSTGEQIEIFRLHGINPTREELDCPATLHSVTAALVIPERYPEFADEMLINAVKYHTMGRENMTLAEKIIYLADYIDETRTYEDCVALRNEFFSAEPEKMSKKEQIDNLNRVILHSFEITIADLTKRGKVISSCTLKAKNSIISELKNS